ncbi:MAG: serine/threonine-protein kinase [Myxococcota bacterium]
MKEAERLLAFVRGELTGRELAEFQRELDEQPRLQRKVADLARSLEASDLESTELEVFETIEVLDRIGSGGMAVVHRARQAKLDRDVAIKTIAEEHINSETARRLLREARITGRLEHPNIVPVHDILLDPSGAPQIILKRIEGDTWSTLLRDPERAQRLASPKELVDWHLGVLITLCQVLSFAHSRGVLHRDLKPDNVMIGRFGETYLLDWGIAVDLKAATAEASPGESEVAGTVAYMAPEQLQGDVALLGPWTDTYLLGATLFHVLTGRPPFPSVTLADRLRAPNALPEIPASLSSPLRAILERCLDPDPTTRMIHPRELREALETMLRRRDASRIVDRATKQLLLAQAARKEGDGVEAERAAIAAEFGFRAALDVWPQSEAAIEGASTLATERIEYALSEGQPEFAARVLASFDAAPTELRRRVERALQRHASEADRLRTIAYHADRFVGIGFRRLLVLIFGTIWIGWWSWVAVHPTSSNANILVTICFVIFGLGVNLLNPEAMLGNRLNRTILFLAMATLATMVVWFLGSSAMRLDQTTTYTVLMLIWGLGSGAAAVSVDYRATPMSLLWIAAFAISASRPSWTPYLLIGGSIVFPLNMLAINIWLSRLQKKARRTSAQDA